MTIRTISNKLETLAQEKNNPCVSISFNTHRTHPANALDAIELKKLLKEAEERVINEFGKRPVAALLEKISTLEEKIDVRNNLDSLHIFLSNDTEEVIRSTWPTDTKGVHIADTFSIRPLIKAFNRSEEYYIVMISQSGVSLFQALNDGITGEINNEDFPFDENPHINTNKEKMSDGKHSDNLVREYLNKVDKAVVKMHNWSGLNCVVICTEDNYSRLMQVADNPAIYIGYSAIDYNNNSIPQLGKQSWEIIKVLQHERRTGAIGEIREAVAQGTVLTDLQEIYQASIDGRGDLLIVHQAFAQPVVMSGERNFDLANDTTLPGVIDDITSTIAWEVLSKKGRVIFTEQDEINTLGMIALKTRY